MVPATTLTSSIGSCCTSAASRIIYRSASVLAHRDSRWYLPNNSSPAIGGASEASSASSSSVAPSSSNHGSQRSPRIFALSPEARFILRPAAHLMPASLSSSIGDGTATTGDSGSSSSSTSNSCSRPNPTAMSPNNVAEARRRVGMYLQELDHVVRTSSTIMRELAQKRAQCEALQQRVVPHDPTVAAAAATSVIADRNPNISGDDDSSSSSAGITTELHKRALLAACVALATGGSYGLLTLLFCSGQ